MGFLAILKRKELILIRWNSQTLGTCAI